MIVLQRRYPIIKELPVTKPFKACGTLILAVVLAFTIFSVNPSSSIAQGNLLDKYLGIWTVELKSRSIFVKNYKTFWEIKQSDESLEISISLPLEKSLDQQTLKFVNIVPQESEILVFKERRGNGGLSVEKYSVDIHFSKTRFSGKFIEGDTHYEVKGQLSDTSRQYREELIRLRNDQISAEDQIATLTQSIDELKAENSLLQGQLSSLREGLQHTVLELEKSQNLVRKKIQELKSTKKRYEAKVDEIKLTYEAKVDKIKLTYEAKVDEIKKTVPQIDFGSLSSNFKARYDTELRAASQKQARSLKKIKEGEPVFMLVEIEDWALIATSQNKLGYVPAAHLVESRGIGHQQPRVLPNEGSELEAAPEAPADNVIVLLDPRWDEGQKGRQITIAAAGFITLSGAVKSKQPVQTLTINQNPIFISRDGSFQTLLNITSSQRMDILATFEDGKSEKLTFELVVNSP